jgi:hypothetical protein
VSEEKNKCALPDLVPEFLHNERFQIRLVVNNQNP